MGDPIWDKLKAAIENKRGLLRGSVIGATVESFPLFRCPGCKVVGDIDFDQFTGRVSIQCINCDYHETRDWSLDNS